MLAGIFPVCLPPQARRVRANEVPCRLAHCVLAEVSSQCFDRVRPDRDWRLPEQPLHCSTRCYAVNMSMPEITQRDLRSRSREIMDAVEHGQAFTVTRDGHQIGELVPIRRRRRFVSRQEFAAMSRNAPGSSLDAFRADQDAVADHEDGGPYDR